MERLEKLIEEKRKRADQEEFHHELKKDMAEYVKGLGEILAGKKGGVQSYSEEVENLMAEADDPYGRVEANMPQFNMSKYHITLVSRYSNHYHSQK